MGEGQNTWQSHEMGQKMLEERRRAEEGHVT